MGGLDSIFPLKFESRTGLNKLNPDLSIYVSGASKAGRSTRHNNAEP